MGPDDASSAEVESQAIVPRNLLRRQANVPQAFCRIWTAGTIDFMPQPRTQDKSKFWAQTGNKGAVKLGIHGHSALQEAKQLLLLLLNTLKSGQPPKAMETEVQAIFSNPRFVGTVLLGLCNILYWNLSSLVEGSRNLLLRVIAGTQRPEESLALATKNDNDEHPSRRQPRRAARQRTATRVAETGDERETDEEEEQSETEENSDARIAKFNAWQKAGRKAAEAMMRGKLDMSWLMLEHQSNSDVASSSAAAKLFLTDQEAAVTAVEQSLALLDVEAGDILSDEAAEPDQAYEPEFVEDDDDDQAAAFFHADFKPTQLGNSDLTQLLQPPAADEGPSQAADTMDIESGTSPALPPLALSGVLATPGGTVVEELVTLRHTEARSARVARRSDAADLADEVLQDAAKGKSRRVRIMATAEDKADPVLFKAKRCLTLIDNYLDREQADKLDDPMQSWAAPMMEVRSTSIMPTLWYPFVKRLVIPFESRAAVFVRNALKARMLEEDAQAGIEFANRIAEFFEQAPEAKILDVDIVTPADSTMKASRRRRVRDSEIDFSIPSSADSSNKHTANFGRSDGLNTNSVGGESLQSLDRLPHCAYQLHSDEFELSPFALDLQTSMPSAGSDRAGEMGTPEVESHVARLRMSSYEPSSIATNQTVKAADEAYDENTWTVKCAIQTLLRRKKASGLVRDQVMITFAELCPHRKVKRWQAAVTLKHLTVLATSGDVVLEQANGLEPIEIREGSLGRILQLPNASHATSSDLVSATWSSADPPSPAQLAAEISRVVAVGESNLVGTQAERGLRAADFIDPTILRHPSPRQTLDSLPAICNGHDATQPSQERESFHTAGGTGESQYGDEPLLNEDGAVHGQSRKRVLMRQPGLGSGYQHAEVHERQPSLANRKRSRRQPSTAADERLPKSPRHRASTGGGSSSSSDEKGSGSAESSGESVQQVSKRCRKEDVRSAHPG